jgi:hypothetical protein
MTADLPDYYFRIRDNGAVVFKLDAENRQRRLDMDEIAVVNVKNGSVKPHGDRPLSPSETALITKWIAERKAMLGAREIDDILRTVDHLNLTTQWAQTRASDAELEQVANHLLLAMHDLRTVLVRKRAENLRRQTESAAD